MDAAKWFVPSETVVGTPRAAEDNDDVEGAPATRHQCDALLVSPRIMELAETANPEGLGARVGVSQCVGSHGKLSFLRSREESWTRAASSEINRLGLPLREARAAAVGGAHVRGTHMFFSVALLGRAAKRAGYLRLTTKRAKKGYYKGKGAIAPGRHTRQGYKLDPLRRPNFITPELDLASFPLKPYVAKTVPKKPELVPGAAPGAAYSTLTRP